MLQRYSPFGKANKERILKGSYKHGRVVRCEPLPLFIIMIAREFSVLFYTVKS